MGVPVTITSEDLALITHACLQSDKSTSGQVCAASRALEILKAAGLGPDGKEKPLTVNGKPSPTSSVSCATLTSTPAHGRKEHDMGKLWEYAIVLKPDDLLVGSCGDLLVPPTPVLAPDEATVRIIAARAIPERWTLCLSRIEVAVRPF